MRHIYKYITHSTIRLWELFLHKPSKKFIASECDLWLVCHEKDYEVAKMTIQSIRDQCLNSIKNFYLISTKKSRPKWLDSEFKYLYEDDLPYIKEIKKLLKNEVYKGWVVQQVLKYSGIYYSKKFIVIDCDTILLKPHLFFNNNSTVIRPSYEQSPQYRLFEYSLKIKFRRFFSFTAHMMPYRKDVLLSLLERIEQTYKVKWQIAIAKFSQEHGMVMNEQDLYARFLMMSGYEYELHPWLNKTVPLEEKEKYSKILKKFKGIRNSISLHNNEKIKHTLK